MPEGPEVKIFTQQLNNLVSGHQLLKIEGIGGRFKNDLTLSTFTQQSLPLKIQQVMCKGKFLYWVLDQEHYIFNTLGMTGKWSLTPDSHSAVKVTTTHQVLFFEDIRRFGTFKVVSGANQLRDKLASLGPDMLHQPPSASEFHQLMIRSSKTLPEILMNQKIISGVGNYIKAEALYRARLSPFRLGKSLTTTDCENLRQAIIAVMQESYQAQGASFLTYGSLEGKGKYASFFQVYRRVADPQGHLVVSCDTADKRTTWWVPAVQV